MGLIKLNLLYLTLCVISSQQCLAQYNKVNNLIDGIWKNLNLTDGGSGIPSISDLLGPSQNELMSRAEEVLGDFVTESRDLFNISEECLDDTEALLAAITRREYWALRMIDAMGKPSSGLQDFQIRWIGNWEECLSVKAHAFQNPINQTGDFRQFGAKFCFASIKINGLPPTIAGQAALQIGVCIPDRCSGKDSAALVNTLISIIPKNLTSRLQPAKVHCQEKELEYSHKAIAAFGVCGIFGIIIAIATIYDVIIHKTETKEVSSYQTNKNGTTKGTFKDQSNYNSNGHTTLEGKANGAYAISEKDVTPVVNGDLEKGKSSPPTPIEFTQSSYTPGTAGKLLLAFSLYTNAPKILSAKQSPGALTAVNGIRFLSMTWVVLGHTYAIGIQYVENLGTYGPALFKRFTFQAIGNATISVDTFFFLSGLLVSYLSLKEMKKCGGPKNFRWGMFYFHRYWRLTPPYMLFLMVYVTTFKYWGDGPLWPQQGAEPGECEDSWWMNLLYINNFFGMDKQCFAWSWYLNNDMQFYIISPIMLIPLYFSSVLGGISCVALILVNFISAGMISYNEKMKANSMFNPDPITSFLDSYIKPWCRIGPYVVGFILGYILYKTECKPKLTKLTNTVGWLLATTFGLLILYGLYSSDGIEKLSLTTAAVYNATHRTVWGACVAWVVYACATGYGGPINALLSWEGVIPLSRLTYCCYLVHPVIMSLYYSSQRTLINWYDLNVAYMFLGHLCVTYGAAFVLSLAFESPMMGLEKVLLGKKKKQ